MIGVEAAGVLHSLMPRSRVIVMPGIGHLPMMEDPKRAARDYLGFLDSLEGR